MGELLVKRVVDAGFDTLDKIKNAKLNELASINGFGELTGRMLKEGIDALYDEMVELLNKNKIKIKAKSTAGKLKGLSFCFTGRLNSMKRAEAEALVERKGGVAKNSVVKGLSYLVTNEMAQTAKFLKAQEQGTKIITEDEFLKMIK